MRINLWVVCSIMAMVLAGAGEASVKSQVVSNSIISEGKKRTYYLFKPHSVSRSKPAPLIVLLHGSGRNGGVLIQHWKELAEQEGIILAGPDSRNSRSWSIPEDGPQFLHDVVEEVKSTHPVDPRRIYLFGHSAGAVFGLFMSALESEYFAAAAVSAGALTESNYPLLDAAGRKIPISLFVGTDDPLFPTHVVRKTRDAFARRGFQVELTEVVGLDHNYYARSGEINEKAWKFLKKHQLADDPQYKEHQFKLN